MTRGSPRQQAFDFVLKRLATVNLVDVRRKVLTRGVLLYPTPPFGFNTPKCSFIAFYFYLGVLNVAMQ